MAKRFGNFEVNVNNKKRKTDEDFEDLWGDDLDANDVDDCFKLATQVWEQDQIPCTQRNNVSILPSYNAFKQKSKRAFTSTQSDPELNSSYHFPTTSKVLDTNGAGATKLKTGKPIENGFKRVCSFDDAKEPPHLDSKLKKLQEQYEAKEGEVTILRNQLKDIRTNNESEQKKKQKEWSDKLTVTTKQLEAVKSELEFKNLEIANLKHKVVEVAKLNNLDTTLNPSQSPYFKQAKPRERSNGQTISAATVNLTSKETTLKLQVALETICPLQDVISPGLFNPRKEEKYLINIKNKRTCRNTIPFLQNQMSQDLTDKLIKLQPKVTMMNNDRRLDLDYIYGDITKLTKCNAYEIETEESYIHINKIVCVSEQLIQNLHDFLQELQNSTQLENNGKVNIMYLESKFENMDLNRSAFDSEQWCDNEMGVAARQSILCISEILPYCCYLRGYLLQNKPLIFKGDEDYLKYLHSAATKSEAGYSNNFNYLNLILSVITLIKKLKKSPNFPGFLSAITVLLDKICVCFNIESVHNLIHRITREIILCSPNMQVLFYITRFLGNASLQSIFVNNLCKMPERNTVQVKHKERILYYNEDTTCVLQLLCILLEDYLPRVQSRKILEVYLNVIKFVSNCIECNPKWLFYQEDKHCDCLCKIVKLYVDIIYQTVKRFHVNNEILAPDEMLKYREILKSGIKTLQFQSVQVSDLIIKHISTYSHYKLIVKLLSLAKILNLTQEDVDILQNLNIGEEVQQIEKFDDIPLWM